MALSQTTRLLLAMYAEGDLDWEVGLNAGMIAADARFLLVSSGDADPNGIIECHYIGQKYLDVESSPPRLWSGTVAAAPGTWALINTTGIKASSAIGGNTILHDILVAHNDAIALNTAFRVGHSTAQGHISGRWVRTSDTVLTFEPLTGGNFTIEINGTMRFRSTGLPFDMASDLIPGESASKWYYFYVEAPGGVLTAVIDDVAPDQVGGTLPGYHPTLANHRCIGSWYNDASQNLETRMAHEGNGWYRFKGHQAWRVSTPGTSLRATWSSAVGLSLPFTCDAAAILAMVRSENQIVVYGATDASTQPAGEVDSPSEGGDAVGFCGGQGPDLHDFYSEFKLPIADPLNPGYKWAHTHTAGAGNSCSTHEVRTQGYYDRCAP